MITIQIWNTQEKQVINQFWLLKWLDYMITVENNKTTMKTVTKAMILKTIEKGKYFSINFAELDVISRIYTPVCEYQIEEDPRLIEALMKF